MSTQATEDRAQSAEEILAVMRKMASAPSQVGEVQPGELVYAGDEDLDAQMIVSQIKEPGLVYIYDTQTGQRSRTSRAMVPVHLTKLRPDGTRVFSERPPKNAKGKIIEPKVGNLKCMLHPDDPNRALYDSWGLPVCTKANLPNLRAREMHVRNRHGSEWATIEHERLRLENDEQRELQKAILRAAAHGQPETEEVPAKTKKAG